MTVDWIRKLRNLLKMSGKSPNFAQQVEQERKRYANLIQNQNVMLDEYEYLVEAYEKELNKQSNQQNDE